jgi:DNA-directed RNA polymerase alpha subunit
MSQIETLIKELKEIEPVESRPPDIYYLLTEEQLNATVEALGQLKRRIEEGRAEANISKRSTWLQKYRMKEVLVKEEIDRVLDMSVCELELSVRIINCLYRAEIDTIGELIKNTDVGLLKYRNFGKKSLDDVKRKLEAMSLRFGLSGLKLKEWIFESPYGAGKS